MEGHHAPPPGADLNWRADNTDLVSTPSAEGVGAVYGKAARDIIEHDKDTAAAPRAAVRRLREGLHRTDRDTATAAT